MEKNIQIINIILKLFSIITLIMFTQSCTKNINCGDTNDMIYTYNVADSNKAKIPYSGYDTLIFISDKGDTATLIGQGKKTYYTTKTTNIGNADCPKNEIGKYENVEFVFNSTNKFVGSIKISLFKTNNVRNPTTNILSFTVNNKFIDDTAIEWIESIKQPQDSIFFNGGFFSGIYMDKFNVLLNYKNGILKFKDLNDKFWVLNK